MYVLTAWVRAGIRGKIPRNAIYGGHDLEGNTIYIGRVKVGESILPCSIIPFKRIAYTTYKGLTIFEEEYDVLCGDTYHWIPARDGEAPEGSLIGGKTAKGENIFVGRVAYKSAVLVGMIVPSEGCLLVSIEGKEECFKEYDVAVLKYREGCVCCTIS